MRRKNIQQRRCQIYAPGMGPSDKEPRKLKGPAAGTVADGGSNRWGGVGAGQSSSIYHRYCRGGGRGVVANE